MSFKGKALKCCEVKEEVNRQKRWKDDKKLMDFLDSL
jgi:hypothetical protein